MEVGVVFGSELKWMVRNVGELETGGSARLSFVETQAEKTALQTKRRLIKYSNNIDGDVEIKGEKNNLPVQCYLHFLHLDIYYHLKCPKNLFQ